MFKVGYPFFVFSVNAYLEKLIVVADEARVDNSLSVRRHSGFTVKAIVESYALLNCTVFVAGKKVVIWSWKRLQQTHYLEVVVTFFKITMEKGIYKFLKNNVFFTFPALFCHTFSLIQS